MARRIVHASSLPSEFLLSEQIDPADYPPDPPPIPVLDPNSIEAKVSNYLEGGGVHCIYCGDSSIIGESVEIDAGRAMQCVTCENCDRTWTDIYTLTHVSLDDDAAAADTDDNDDADD
jgi:hypothetical protein